MMTHEIRYSLTGYSTDLTVEVTWSEKVKISDKTINKALMISMNYLMENMETEEYEHESAE